jgi:hypothetical protein
MKSVSLFTAPLQRSTLFQRLLFAPEKRCTRFGSVCVKVDWKCWSPTVKASASA